MLQGRTAVAACAVPVVPIAPTSARAMSAVAAPVDNSALTRLRCLVRIKETTLPAGRCRGSSGLVWAAPPMPGRRWISGCER
jgi:hypothetical protein